jgi:TATA-binding protein-associated factor Taf7
VSRDYEPVPGQWYENLEEEEPFRVLTMDEDSELVEIEYLDGDIEEIDLETWHEMDLELTQEPEGWAASQEEEDDEDDEDDDWDDEDEDDDDLDDDEDEDEAEDREQYSDVLAWVRPTSTIGITRKSPRGCTFR